MTEAEIMEKLNQKRTTLEQYKAGSTAVSESEMKALEDEIKQLETSLSGGEAKPRRARRTAFLDECAG
jgi:hypothetical protein